jgi:hypothetical protein
MSAKIALISAFVALQVADVLTTQHVLAAGGFEANPLVAWAMDHCGAWWPLAKLAPMALVTMVMTRWRPRYIVPGVALMAAMVASNALQGNNGVLATLILFSLAMAGACWVAHRAKDVRSRFNEEWSENRSDFISAGDQLGDVSTGSKRDDCNINMLG